MSQPTTYGTLDGRDPRPNTTRDDERANAILRLWRPRSALQWARWHIRRAKARRLLRRQPDGEELIYMLGLDSASERVLIHKLETSDDDIG